MVQDEVARRGRQGCQRVMHGFVWETWARHPFIGLDIVDVYGCE
jgi:hypothetical protein